MTTNMNAVPLPEVAEYTDRIFIRELGLPVGFDEERLLVNVRGLERVCSYAGMTALIISGVDASKPTEDYSIDGWASDGTATLGKKQKLAPAFRRFKTHEETGLYDYYGDSGKLYREHFSHAGPLGYAASVSSSGLVKGTYNYPFHLIIDTAKRDAFMRASSKRRHMDARSQAAFLNQGLKQELRVANRMASIDAQQLAGSALVASFFLMVPELASSFATGSGLPLEAAALGIMVGQTGLRLALSKTVTDEERDSWLEARRSLFVGMSPDRFALGALAINSSRFIKAKA